MSVEQGLCAGLETGGAQYFLKHKTSVMMCSKKVKGYTRIARRMVCPQSILFFALTIIATRTNAQQGDGNAGIKQATDMVKGYFATGTTLLYAIGAIVGLVGAVKVYNKWNSGDQDTSKVAAAWFGSCIFLVVVATVLKSFFGV